MYEHVLTILVVRGRSLVPGGVRMSSSGPSSEIGYSTLGCEFQRLYVVILNCSDTNFCCCSALRINRSFGLSGSNSRDKINLCVLRDSSVKKKFSTSSSPGGSPAPSVGHGFTSRGVN